MKKILCLSIVLITAMLILPLAVMEKPANVSALGTETAISEAQNAVSDNFKVLDTSTDKITELSSNDYIFGVVAAEMPALYEEEALKAQAVAAYTFACYRRVENSDKSYDITSDHLIDQSFITEEKAREKWGDKADEYCEKIKKAVEDTENIMITYDNKPILAVYHAISSGKTEDAKDVWGTSYPYLTAKQSTFDTLSNTYISKTVFTTEKLKSVLADAVALSGEEANYFGKPVRTDSGMVKTISVCNTELNGAKIRSLLGLRSSNFEISYKDGSFTFTVYGYGHGVGMSQYGADYMAKQGSNYKEILSHYYNDCQILSIK